MAQYVTRIAEQFTPASPARHRLCQLDPAVVARRCWSPISRAAAVAVADLGSELELVAGGAVVVADGDLAPAPPVRPIYEIEGTDKHRGRKG